MQDQPFAICGQFGTACNLTLAFKIHLISFQLCAINLERKLALKNEVVGLHRNSSAYAKSKHTLQHFEKFKNLGVVFASDGRQNKETDAQISKANTVLRELYCSLPTKRELSSTAKLSVFKSAFVPMLNYDHEFRLMPGVLVQVAEIEISRKMHAVTLHGKVHSSKIRKILNVKPLLRIRPSRWYASRPTPVFLKKIHSQLLFLLIGFW